MILAMPLFRRTGPDPSDRLLWNKFSDLVRMVCLYNGCLLSLRFVVTSGRGVAGGEQHADRTTPSVPGTTPSVPGVIESGTYVS